MGAGCIQQQGYMSTGGHMHYNSYGHSNMMGGPMMMNTMPMQPGMFGVQQNMMMNNGMGYHNGMIHQGMGFRGFWIDF